jgi:hypothetical protein
MRLGLILIIIFTVIIVLLLIFAFDLHLRIINRKLLLKQKTVLIEITPPSFSEK